MYAPQRNQHNPLLRPIESRGWEGLATCNGCPVIHQDIMHFVYRAMGDPDRLSATNLPRSTIGYAKSFDGVHFQDRISLIAPEYPWEEFGCEDPRMTFFEGKFYILYTALGGYPLNHTNIKVALGIGDQPNQINERHLLTPFNAKAAALFPERINGKIAIILTANTDMPPAKIALRFVDTIEDLWDYDAWEKWHQRIDDHAIDLNRRDDDHVEIGAPPILTDDGWLLIYSHTQNYFDANRRIFGVEAVLLDKNNPQKIIGRTNYPLLVPETMYERYGLVSNVVFPTGALAREDDILDIYYGAADTTCCKVSLSLSGLLQELNPQTYKSDVMRVSKYPILSPQGDGWESRLVFNPAAIDIEGRIYIIYRAMDAHNTSRFGLAVSDDGVTISERLPDPIYEPREEFETKKGSENGYSGCEDPRITRIGNHLYMCYTAYNGHDQPRVAVTTISVNDFLDRNWRAWTTPVLMTPRDIDDKDACILPIPLYGQYMFIHRIQSHICADLLPDLEFESEEITKCIEILEPRRGMWDSQKVGIAGPPLETDQGWLMLYHGVSDDNIYRVGAALLDRDDPTVVIARTAHAIFEPREEWELRGEVDNVVFPCGSIIRDDTIYIYYGGADSHIGIAQLSLSHILRVLTQK